MKYRILHGMLRVLARLPLGALYILSDAAAFILHKVVRYRVNVVRKNLTIAFPDKSDNERRIIERDFYRHLCDIFIETTKLAHISDAQVDRRITIEGAENLDHAIREGKSVVLFLGHFGNWEWVTSIARRVPPGAVSCQIYHPLRDKAIDRLMLTLRSRFGSENIPMNHTLRRLVEIHKEGKNFVCGFIADQRPLTPVLKHWTRFFGVDTPYLNGGEVIGTMMEAVFIYVEMMPGKRGHYTMSLCPLVPMSDSEENPWTRAYLAKLEESIQRCPYAWLWSHNRWRNRR